MAGTSTTSAERDGAATGPVQTYPAGAEGVVAVALKLFTARGFAGTSLQDIAEELGVTKAAIYYHFKTKDAILRAVLTPIFGDMRAVLADLDTYSGRAAERRQQGVEAFVEYLINNRDLMSYLSGDAAAVDQPWVAEAVGEFGERLHGLFVGPEQDTLSVLWSHAIVSALTGAVTQSLDVADDELRVELVAMCDALTLGYRKARRLRSRDGDDHS